MSTTVLRRLVVATVVAAATVGAVTPANAAAKQAPQHVSVTAQTDRLVAPAAATLRPGVTTFEVSTPDFGGREVGLIKLKPGVQLDNLLANLGTVLHNEDLEAKKAAGAVVYRDSVLLGGAIVTPRAPQIFSQMLFEGTYYLVDYRSLANPAATNHYQKITVGRGFNSYWPGVDHVVLQYQESNGDPRFRAPATIKSGARLLIINLTDQMADSVFLPVAPGTTGEDIAKFFQGQSAPPFIGQPQGALPASAGYAVHYKADLAPGRYVLLSFVGDRETGYPGAARGMYKIIDVV
ncbi:hypothetical protein [Actinokineospora sp. HUAS TT18]|uniref:hypothetical protein n=1 Tax=Actinokineospora sp. HUAS TT18 TaxID=3447451 RepID=UPI003F52903E